MLKAHNDTCQCETTTHTCSVSTVSTFQTYNNETTKNCMQILSESNPSNIKMGHK